MRRPAQTHYMKDAKQSYGNTVMATGPMQNLLKQLRKVLAPRRESGASDAELLERFFASHDDAAFELLVWRHHRMVLGVCNRILAESNDVEDAFQATFLVLARKGRSIRKRGSLSSWLFGVARRVALEASRGTQRLQPSGLTLPSSCPEPVDELMRQEFHGIVDQELGHLPEKYRAPVVLCYLEGMTYEEAGQHLGCSKGTISTRLTRARELLRTRLASRGLAVSAGLLAAWLCENAASAGAPSSLVASTIKAATSLASGQATGMISTHVAALTEGVLKTMFLSKLKAVVAVVLVLGFFVTGATVVTYRTVAAQSDKPPTAERPAATPQKPEQDKEAFTAWGKEVGGLQAGLGFLPGQKRAYSHGEKVTLVVRVRNVGKEEVTFQYLSEFFMEKPPAVTDAAGKPVPQASINIGGLAHLPKEVKLAPGKKVELAELKLELRPAIEGLLPRGPYRIKQSGNDRFSTLYGTGKVSLQYEQVFGTSSAGRPKNAPALSRLATGKLELEIKSDPPPAATENADKEALAKAAAAKAADRGDEKAKEPPWGEAVGGWRMRLTTPSGTEYRANTPLPLSVELQNVSGGSLSLGLLAPYAEPEVTADGKRLITRTPIDISPWEGRRDQFRAGASLKWSVDFDRLRFATQPLKAGTALRVRFRLPMQGETPEGKPDDGKQRLLFSNEVSLKLKDDHPSILSGEAGLPAKWTHSTELVYREHVPLLGYDALRIDGAGRAWLVSVGRGKGQPPAAGPIRTEVVLKQEDLERLAKFLRDQKLWELPDLSQAKIPAPDEGEIRISIGAGRGSLVGSVANSSVSGQPKLQALQAEMAKVMAIVREKAATKPPVEEPQRPEVRIQRPKRIEAIPMEKFIGRFGVPQGDSIEVTFEVDERSFLRYQRLLGKGQVKGPGSPLHLGLADEDGFPHQGTLKSFADRIDPKTGTVQARGGLPNPDRLFLSGMFVRVRIPFGPPQKVLQVPEQAVLTDLGKHYLMVVTDKDILERRAVSLGTTEGNLRIIQSGVSADDWIVVSGLTNLMPGTQVKRRIAGDAP
jgi:RNA polymerase sigma factor (sigma-70 family)